MYDTLLQLPLFQGLCETDFTAIIEKVKFHFHNYSSNEVIAHQNEPCNSLIFLLNGEVVAKTRQPDLNFTLSEVITSPAIIEPYSLFGMNVNFTSTYQVKTKARLLTIDKSYILTELNKYEIFRLNYINLLSNRAQSAHKILWNLKIGSIQEKLLQFLTVRCQYMTGQKTLSITMEDLSMNINETRINVSRLLNELQDRELIQLKRKKIIIPSIEKLLDGFGYQP